MKLAILGANSPTGQQVLNLALTAGHHVHAIIHHHHQLNAHPKLTISQGDLLEPAPLIPSLQGCHAIISVVGPGPQSPPDLSSQSAHHLISIMHELAIPTLVLVTGAMCGPRQNMGVFYKLITSIPSLERTLEDRRKQERILLESGLNVIILRPPRLTDKAPQASPQQLKEVTIRLSDECSRADLADVLLAHATAPQTTSKALYLRSPRSPRAFFKAWLLRCGLAELAGLGLAALAATQGLASANDSPQLQLKLLSYMGFIFVGALEGAFIGLAQASLLASPLPKLRVWRMTALTSLIAAMAWAIGMAPSTWFAPAAQVASAAPSPMVITTSSVIGGAIGGLIIAAMQLIELRHHLHKKMQKRWLLASAAGWGIALPIDILGASLPSSQWHPWQIITLSALAGLLAGLAFAAPTGLIALRLCDAPHPAGRDSSFLL